MIKRGQRRKSTRLSYSDNLLEAAEAEEEVIHRTVCLIRIAHPFRIRWDLFVMALALWNCFSIPFIVAFIPELGSDPSIFALNIAIDIIFFVDIILNFRTTYFHRHTGDEVMDPKTIAKHYFFGGKFVIDLLASIPIDLVVEIAVG